MMTVHAPQCFVAHSARSTLEPARALYQSHCARGTRARALSRLLGRPWRLMALDEVGRVLPTGAQRDAGVVTVPICQIQGSEGRATDFDSRFCPLAGHLRERWVGIAAARLRGRPLPPVVLVKVGGIYFVRDGHHRISVAVALGEKSIEAKVLVWAASDETPGLAEAADVRQAFLPRGQFPQLVAR